MALIALQIMLRETELHLQTIIHASIVSTKCMHECSAFLNSLFS